jgi:hypothetical protein
MSARAFPFFCVLAGLAAGTLALAGIFTLGIFGLFACEGIESPPPEPGSLTHTLCEWPATVAILTCLPVAVGAPVVGGIWSAVAGRGHPLAIAFLVAAAAMTALSLFMGVLVDWGWLVVPAAAVLVAAVMIERRVARRQRRPS